MTQENALGRSEIRNHSIQSSEFVRRQKMQLTKKIDIRFEVKEATDER